MSNEFKFNPAQVTPQTSVAVDAKPVVQGSPEERIAQARTKGLELSKTNNPVHGLYGMHYPPEHFKDYGHGSAWLGRRLYFMASELRTRVNGKPLPLGEQGQFNPATGKFDGLGFSLSDLLRAFQERISELGISQMLLEEWTSTPHPLDADQKYYSMTFEERCALWKESV